MKNSQTTPGIAPARLSDEDYDSNFSDLYDALDAHEAIVAADRCYFCHDAPCITACPTDIDIPLFIRQIQTGMPASAGQTILQQNILGGMCARVCPTETLCEGACVRETAEGKPVEIGRLQRFATDTVMAKASHPFVRAPETGQRIAVIGTGPAGLACAHRLAVYGHSVVMYDGNAKPGGLNEYGIATYKAPDNFAQKEVEWLMDVGGITVKSGVLLGREVSLSELVDDYDAVFLGIGLQGVNALRTEGENYDNVVDAVDFIAELRQSTARSTLPVGRHVVVIGGGMTAVDAAVQSKLLGAEHVTMVYRRNEDQMGASEHERLHAVSKGVRIITGAAPKKVIGSGHVEAIEFAYTEVAPDGLKIGPDGFTLPADQVFKAIGQRLSAVPESIKLEGGKIAVGAAGQTSLDSVWAGGDCAVGGDDLTVTAVAEGRDAAEDIHAKLIAAQSVAAE